MTKLIWAIIISFLLSVILMPLVIKLIKKFACSQTILKYVEEHKSKQGTPTLGGIVFFLVTFILIFFFLDYSTNWFLCLMVAFSFALLGGMDDFIKVKFKRNLGLKPYQKIVGQLGISFILAFYIFYNVGTSINIPFFNSSINCGFMIIPIVIITCIATTNSVNLTDGLDGLAGSVSSIVFGIIIVILITIKKDAFNSGESIEFVNNYENLSILLSIFLGSILGFLVFNTNKASIFMGDMGSLGIGGMLSSVLCITGLELSLLVIGVCFVASALSVIIQVFVFKKYKKRVFKMSPLHHHFQQCGYSESKITYCYSSITLIMGLLLIVSYL